MNAVTSPRPAVVAEPFVHQAARVIALGDDDPARCDVTAEDWQGTARRAASCLLDPAPGDEVLIARSGRRAYVVAVLERVAPDSAATLGVAGADKLCLAAPELALEAGHSLGARTPVLTVAATRVRARLGTVQALGHALKSRWDQVFSGTRRRDQISDLAVERTGTRIVAVDELDILKAGQRQEEVKAARVVRAGHVDTVARGEVRIDGKRINLG